MQKASEEFEKRKIEIEKYFTFISFLDKDNPNLHFSEMGIEKSVKVEDELLKILKANGFLLIYNLVESACRNSLCEILDAIQLEKLSLQKLTDEVQLLWIKQRTQSLRDSKTKLETVDKQFHEIAKDVISNTIIDFGAAIKKIENPNTSELQLFGLSGNINADKIRDMARICGFESRVNPQQEKAGADLEEVKEKRNHLAHGRVTFAECGKDYSVPQMIKFKDNAILYIEGVLTNIDQHIKQRKFKYKKGAAKKTVKAPAKKTSAKKSAKKT